MKKKTKKKIYEIIEKIVVFLTVYFSIVALGVWAFMQNTIY